VDTSEARHLDRLDGLLLPVTPGLYKPYLRCGVRDCDDVSHMRLVQPDWTGQRPRF
jgi:hypothetical protein